MDVACLSADFIEKNIFIFIIISFMAVKDYYWVPHRAVPEYDLNVEPWE